MKKKYIILILILAVFGTWGSCKQDFLVVAPAGSLDESLLLNQKGLDALMVGAYSMIDGVANMSFDQTYGAWETSATNFVWGSIRGLEGNKGSESGDQPVLVPIVNFTEDASNGYLNDKWKEVYEAISRCNAVIKLTAKTLAAGKITSDQADIYTEQARVLRGWYHFDAWRLWGFVPYMDETTDPATVTNAVDISDKIILDLTEGTKLPINMGQLGAFNKTVSQVLLARVLMHAKHDYAGAKALLLDVVANGKKPNGGDIGLAPTFGEIFNIENRNDLESVYTVQSSINDGSSAWNAGPGEVLNFPYKSGASPGGCCGFFSPTQEFVNSFRTFNGLPLLDDSYNVGANQVKNDQGISANTTAPIATGIVVSDPSFTTDAGPLDPRLDWTVGRRGIAFWDWGLHTGMDWIREQSYAGPYNPKKQVYKKSQEKVLTDISSWTAGYTANGYRMIRYADVLLMLAECQIETNELDLALANINQVRHRAANPLGFVKTLDADGKDTATPAANYVINEYTTLGSQDNARTILRMERKLELGLEGHRMFDLNRWGITVAELNRVLAYEKGMAWGPRMYGNAVVSEKHLTYPIPQRQIDLSIGKLTQTPLH
jgi:starch-binding outer membrane protein, SusD/RagB family